MMEGLKLLILGDQSENIISMEALLRDIEGLDILRAKTEDAAIQLCLHHDISIILMDQQLPGEGAGLAGLLHERSVNYEEPIILAVTDHGLQNSIDRSNTNIIEYLYRPFDDNRIKTRVILLVQMLQARRLLKVADDSDQLDEAIDNRLSNQKSDNLLRNDLPANIDTLVSDLTGKRVLLAEDNELNSFMVIHMLNSWGMEADAVSNGKEALEQLLTERYDIVLMDTQMPVMGGYDAMRLIRMSLREPLNRIPIISLSASVLLEEQEAARMAGANDVVGKPFQPDILHNKILKLLF